MIKQKTTRIAPDRVILLIALLSVTFAKGASAQPTNPAPTNSAIPPSFFCMTVQKATTTTPWPDVPFAGIRTWDSFKVAWSFLNPAPGVYKWDRLDAVLDLAQRHKVDVLYTFGRTPQWASSSPNQRCGYDPGACMPPSRMENWDNFVRAIATHARGRIKYWEIWNEPNQSEYWSGDVRSLVTMAGHAYAIIKSIDPAAQILTPSAVGGVRDTPAWMDSYFAAGGGPFTDIVAFHGYGKTPAVPEYVVGLLDAVETVLTKFGQSDKPLWDTEASWGPVTHLPDLEDQIGFVARHYILQWSKGVQRYYWYAWDDDKYGTMWDASGGERKPAIAYREVYHWLVGATLEGPCEMASDSTWSCTLSRPGGYEAMVVWSPGGLKTLTPLGRFVQYRTLEGEVLAVRGSVVVGKQPVLLETSTASR